MTQLLIVFRCFWEISSSNNSLFPYVTRFKINLKLCAKKLPFLIILFNSIPMENFLNIIFRRQTIFQTFFFVCFCGRENCSQFFKFFSIFSSFLLHKFPLPSFALKHLFRMAKLFFGGKFTRAFLLFSFELFQLV